MAVFPDGKELPLERIVGHGVADNEGEEHGPWTHGFGGGVELQEKRHASGILWDLFTALQASKEDKMAGSAPFQTG